MGDEMSIDKRFELHDFLISLITPNKVYFQPPSSHKITYPCIIYKLDDVDIQYADSIKYKNKKRYLVTVIDKNPDSEIFNKILELDYCNLDGSYISDNLNHYIFTLYY